MHGRRAFDGLQDGAQCGVPMTEASGAASCQQGITSLATLSPASEIRVK